MTPLYVGEILYGGSCEYPTPEEYGFRRMVAKDLADNSVTLVPHRSNADRYPQRRCLLVGNLLVLEGFAE